MGVIADLKRELVEQLLASQDYILVVVHPLVPGVVLPEAVTAPRQPVALHIGYRTAIPIPDLTVDEHGIGATLSFGREPFRCEIPWEALFQVSVEEEHLIWMIPPPEEPQGEPEQVAPDDDRPRRGHLKLV